MSTNHAVRPGRLKRLVRPGGFIDKYFYLFMSLLVAAVVVKGFSHSIGRGLVHAAIRRPALLWVHGIVFSAFIAVFVFQSALVSVHRVKLHRILGWYFAGLGALIPVLGIATTQVMYRFDIAHLHGDPDELAAILSFPLLDMVVFTVAFGVAVLWRKRPEYHRRLVLVAACVLTEAAFGRIHQTPTYLRFYIGVDGLILLGVFRDLLINRRVHPVYAWFVPPMVFLQFGAIYVANNRPEWWLNIGHAFIGKAG
jgi:hypothetical protein